MNGRTKPELSERIKEILGPSQGAPLRHLSADTLSLLGALLAIFVVLYLLWAKGSGDTDVAYMTERARRGNLTVVVTATGSVQATRVSGTSIAYG